MELNWMGRYRPLIDTLVRHRNAYARAINHKTECIEDVSLSLLEWEVLEYIIEHESDDASMIQISERLAIPQSSFSKFTRTLCSCGLVAKYQMIGNRKNIILKATDKGMEFYRKRVEYLMKYVFGEFFQHLDGLSEEDLAAVTRAIACLNHDLEEPSAKEGTHELIRLE